MTRVSESSKVSSSRVFTMPLPQDDTLPIGSSASNSASAIPSEPTTEEILHKFKQLGAQAAAEEGDEDEDEADDGEDEDAAGGDDAVADGSNSGAGGEGAKKKKKKKKSKSKASKAVAKLK